MKAEYEIAPKVFSPNLQKAWKRLKIQGFALCSGEQKPYRVGAQRYTTAALFDVDAIKREKASTIALN